MPLFLTWFIVGVVLAILELIVPGTYLIWFGMASLITAGITYVFPDLGMMWQLIWLALFSLLFAFIGWKVYGRLVFTTNFPEQYKNLNDPIAQLTGKEVEVVSVKGDKIQVEIGDTVWTASCSEKLKAGDRVIILGSSNHVELNVKKAPVAKKKK